MRRGKGKTCEKGPARGRDRVRRKWPEKTGHYKMPVR